MIERPRDIEQTKDAYEWRAIRPGDVDDARSIITLQLESLGKEASTPIDEELLKKTDFEGLIIHKGRAAVGYVMAANDAMMESVPKNTFPPDTLVFIFAYLRDDDWDMDKQEGAIDAIRSYAKARGKRHIGWFSPDTTMHGLTGRSNFADSAGDMVVPSTGATVVPVDSLTFEIFKKIQHAQGGSAALQ